MAGVFRRQMRRGMEIKEVVQLKTAVTRNAAAGEAGLSKESKKAEAEKTEKSEAKE